MEDTLDIQEVQQQVPTQEDPPLKKLWKGLKSDGKYTKSYDDFVKKYSTPESIYQLHKGLSEDGDYTKSIDDFKSQYFTTEKKKVGKINLDLSSLESGNSLSPSNGEVLQKEVNPVDTDPIELSRKYNDLKKIKLQSVLDFGSENNTIGDNAIKEANKIEEDFKKKGLNINKVYSDYEGIPNDFFEHEATSKEAMFKMDKDNPIKKQFILNSAKNTYLIAKNSDNHTANLYNRFNDFEYGSLTDFINGKRKQQEIINSTLTGDDRINANLRLEQNSAPFINAINPDLIESYNSSDLKDKIDANQYAGLKTLEIFEPEKYQQYLNILNKGITQKYDIPLSDEVLRNFQSPVAAGVPKPQTTDSLYASKLGGKISQETIDQKIGKETILRQLSDLGRYNAITNLQREQYELNNQFEKSTNPQEQAQLKQKYLHNQEVLNGINELSKQDDTNFPLTAKMKFDKQVKELTQSPGMGLVGYGINRFLKGFSNTGESIEDIVTGLFGSKNDNTDLSMKRLGQMQDWENQMYLPENLKSENSPVILKPTDQLKGLVNTILKGRKLSDLSVDERQRLNKLVEINQDQIETITNPNAGKSKNFFSKATLYQNAGFLGDVGSLIAQTYGLGALGAGKIVSSMMPMFTTSYSDFYNQAISEGKLPDAANEYATAHGGIMALAGLVNPKFDIAKRAVGVNTAAGKFMAGISEETWNKVVSANKPMLDKFKNAALGVAEEATKMTSVYGVGTSIANDLIDNSSGYKNISVDEMVNHAISSGKDILFSSAGLLGTNFITHISKGVPLRDKAMLWELGDNPDLGIAKIDESILKGELTPEEGDLRKKAIKDISSLISKVPTENAKNEKLTDKKRVEYLYNLYVENKLKSEKSNLPKTQSEKAEQKSLVAKFDNDIIAESPTNNQLQSRKTKIEKELEPKKDENGKVTELPEQEKKNLNAELEAINNKLEENKKEVKLPTLSEPLEDTNSKGIPLQEETVEGDKKQQADKEVDDFLRSKYPTYNEQLKQQGKPMVSFSDAKEVLKDKFKNEIDGINNKFNQKEDIPLGDNVPIEVKSETTTIPVESKGKDVVVDEGVGVGDKPVTKPTFENVAIETHTPEEVDNAKNEIFNNASQLKVGQVIDGGDNLVKVVTDNSIDSKGTHRVGIVTFERQPDGSLIQRTNQVWVTKNSEGKINVDYNPHETATNTKGERVTTTDKITDDNIDLSKEKVFIEDADGNLVETKAFESFKPKDAPQSLSTNPETKVNEELPDTKVQQPTEDKITTTEEPNKEVPKSEKGTGGNEPPKGEVKDESNDGEDWTAIRKEKQVEVDAVKKAYEEQGVKGWSESMKQGLQKVQKLFPDKNLYDSALSLMHQIRMGGKRGDLTADEALATMHYLKMEIERKRSELAKDVTSDNSIERELSAFLDDNLQSDYENTALAAKAITTEAGRTLSYAASEIRLHPKYGLQIRRMELMKKKGEPLSEEDMKWTEAQWEKEKEIMKQEEEIRSQQMKEEFDNKIAELQKEYEDRVNNNKPTTPVARQKRSQQIKDIAQRIRTQNELDKFAKAAEGTIHKSSLFGDVDFKELAAQALEYIAKGVEKGEDIRKMLSDAARKFKGKFDEDDFKKAINFIVTKSSLPTKEEVTDKIKAFVKENDVTDITNEMVGANLIRDYVNSHIGEVEQKDLFDKAFKDLKKELPDLTKEKFTEAYLKEKEFKQPTKKDLEGSVAEQKKQLKSIAKNEEDIKDLEGLKQIRQRSFPTEREKSEYEQKIYNEKNAKLKEISDRNRQIREDNKRLESERVRQLNKVSELQKRKSKLEQGVIEKTEARDRKLDTPEIEKLKSQIKQLEKDIRSAESAQRSAERKIESDRNKGIKIDNRKIESEVIRQMNRVNELTDKKNKLENGIREKKSVNKIVDTPEIENLKSQVKEADKNLREAESEAKRIANEIQEKKDKIAELDANIERAKNDMDLIKTHKNKTDKQIDEDIAAKQKELKKAVNDNSSDERVQAKKLQEAKENAVKKTKEFQRKIDEGEFEEPKPTVKLKKSDAELIRLKKQESVIEEAYRKKQNAYKEKNKSRLERAADFARSAYIAVLIGAPKTLAKVASMSLMRPISEASSKLTFGKVFDTFFPKISEAAKRGGESSSWRSVQTGFEAYFRQMGDKRMEKMYQNASSEYDKAAKAYNDYKKSANPDAKKLERLKTNVNNKLMKVQGSFIYKFIGGSSLKDALKALVNRSNEIEKQFGKGEGESIKDGNLLDKVNYVLGFIGRSHSAAKTFSGRFSFAAGFMARLEGAVKNGEDINSPDKILEIAHESYLDWERGKYQQSNQISDLWNKLTNNISNGEIGTDREGTAKVMAALLKTEVAITRVPVNILHEAIMEYTFGAFKALAMAAKNSKEIKAQLKEEGFTNGEKLVDDITTGTSKEEFKKALKEKISQMDEKQAATIARCFRKGGLGAGLYATVLITAAIHFGIFPHMGQKKKKEEDQLAPDELNPGQIMVGDTKLGEVTSGIIEHIPALWPTFMGLGMAQAYDDEIKKGKSTKEAVIKSIYTHLKVVESGIPQSKIISPTRVGETIYQGVKKKAENSGLIDTNKTGYSDSELEVPEKKLFTDKGIKVEVPQDKKTESFKVDGKEISDEDFKKVQGEWKVQFDALTKELYEKGLRYYPEGKGTEDNPKPYEVIKLDDKDQIKEVLDRMEITEKEFKEALQTKKESISDKAKKIAMNKFFPDKVKLPKGVFALNEDD